MPVLLLASCAGENQDSELLCCPVLSEFFLLLYQHLCVAKSATLCAYDHKKHTLKYSCSFPLLK